MTRWYQWTLIFFSLTQIAFADPIQFDVVNKLLQDIVKAVTKYDDLVEYARPAFNERFSDIQAGRLSYQIDGFLKNSPWSPEKKSVVVAGASFIVDNNKTHQGVIAASSVKVEVDSLALFREAGRVALERNPQPPSKYLTRVKDTLVQISRVNDLTKLYQILNAAKQLAIEIELDQIKQRPENAARFKEIMKSFDSFKIMALPRPEQVSEIFILSPDISAFAKGTKFAVFPYLAQIQITETSLRVEVKGFAPLSKDQIDKLKSDLTNSLVQIQMNVPEENERLSRKFEKALIVFKQAIREGKIQ
jgi:hypothetical protein